mgnify:CR=1 FL=1
MPESETIRLQKRAEHYIRQTKYREALAVLDQAIKLDPKNAMSWYLRASAKIEMEKFAEAIADCEQALAINPNYADAWTKKALALYHLEQYIPALASSTRASTLNANDASAWYIRGICLEELGKSEEAEIAYAKSLELEIILDIKEEGKRIRK